MQNVYLHWNISNLNVQLALVIAAEASNQEEQELVDVAYEALVKLGTSPRYGLSQALQAQTDGNPLHKLFARNIFADSPSLVWAIECIALVCNKIS